MSSGKVPQVDLFGTTIIPQVLLRDRFLEPPFSVIDSRTGSFQNRKRKWLDLGIKSEEGRDVCSMHSKSLMETRGEKEGNALREGASVFNPALTELMYSWFCPDGGKILDPFAGGSVRGIVANYLGYSYTGIELRPEQIASNNEQAATITPSKPPLWICGDSDTELEKVGFNFDFAFSCPPYFNLEVYSDDPNDLSNMTYEAFTLKHASIIKKTCGCLKSGAYAVWVIGEVRDKKGNYVGFVPDTIKAFQACGMRFYNDAVLLNVVGTAALRAGKQMDASKKLVKIHQNIICFRKP